LPKKDEKRLATDPFERFLPQIGDSRKKKDADINNANDADNNVDNSTNSSVIIDKNKNNDVAVNVSNVADKIVNNDVNNNKNNYSNSADVVNKISTVNNVDDVSNDNSNAIAVETVVDNDIDISTAVDDDIYGNSDIASDVAAGDDVAVSTLGTFKIQKKTPKSNHYTRATFYLRPDQLRTINRLHKDSGRDKSELVRMAVDILIKRATVE
jgi:hypothetical protein